jgi:ATP-dependent Lon protease
MLPARNRRDADELSEETRRQLELIFLEHVEDAMGAALEEKPATVAA